MKVSYKDPGVEEAFDRGFRDGDYKGAMERTADALAARFEKSYLRLTDVSMLYLEAGDKARCLDWLEKGYEVRDQVEPYIGVPVWADRLRAEPRYQELLHRMKLPAS
jgi:hypothetical protein